MNSNDSTKNKRRYTPEEKQSVLDFIAERKTQNKRGAQKEAAERFGISTVTISSWMKASKAKRGRKKAEPKVEVVAEAAEVKEEAKEAPKTEEKPKAKRGRKKAEPKAEPKAE